MRSKFSLSKLSVIIYWLIFLVLLYLFFTNDFGLVDIHKTAIITAVGIDWEEDEVQVTCEVAVPQPSQSGDNIKYTQIQGSGITIADALNEVNSKTGFYPKLQFCKLILVGESCQEKELFRVLGCFYRKNYSELTADVAMCKGKASDMLSLKSPVSDMTSEAIRNALSEEIEKSANATSTNLKQIAMEEYSVSRSCYMPYVEANIPGTSESGGGGENVGGESGEGSSGQQNQGSSGGDSGGSGGTSGGEGESSGGSSQNGSGNEMEFTARKTAIFSGGKFKGILEEKQSFALAVLEGEIRLAVLGCEADDRHYTLGLKNVDGGVSLKIEDGKPVLNVNFSAAAQIQGVAVPVDPRETAHDDVVPDSVLRGVEEELKSRFESLIGVSSENDCDILKIKQQLYKFHTKYFEQMKDDILNKMEVRYDVKVISVN